MPSGFQIYFCFPLHPGSIRQRRRDVGGLPFAITDLDLYSIDPAQRRPGHAGNDVRSRIQHLARGGDVDPRLSLDRCLLGPAARDPITVEAVPGGELDLGEPFGGRYVSIQPRHDQPRREPVSPRQRISVHPEGDERTAAVIGEVRGKTCGKAVDGASDQLACIGLQPGQVQHVR